MTNLDSIFKSRDITLPTKVHLVKAMVFPVVTYGCESWTVKKAEHQRIDVLNCGVGEDSWESLELQGDPTSPFWRRSVWMFIGRTDAEAETPILWPPDADSWLTGKDPDAGRDWGQEKKGTTEDEKAEFHHRLDGHESEWTPGAGDRQGGLECCDSWGRKELDTTEWLNWTELNCRLFISHVKQYLGRFKLPYLCSASGTWFTSSMSCIDVQMRPNPANTGKLKLE